MDSEIHSEDGPKDTSNAERSNSPKITIVYNDNDDLKHKSGKLPDPKRVRLMRKLTKKWWKDNHEIISTCLTFAAVLVSFLSLHESKVAATYTENSFKENIKQFEIANQPFLQIAKCNLHMNDVKHNVEITFDVQNIGKYPAKILRHIYYWNPVLPNTIKNLEFPMKQLNGSYFENVNQYIVSDDRAESFIPDTMRKGIYDSIKSKNLSFYFCGKIFYLNLANKKKLCYEFNVRIVQIEYFHYDLVKDSAVQNKFNGSIKLVSDSSIVDYTYNENYPIE